MSAPTPRVLAGRRPIVAIALAAVLLVMAAVPAGAHAGFKAYSAFGFAPNPTGGSNAASGDQSTPPYEAGVAVQMAMRAAVEVPTGETWDPALHSNVDMKVTVPDGWTSPTCGSANRQVNDGSTNSTNQPGPVVAGWQCETYSSMGHTIIHFWGPPVASGGSQSDAAQYFLFTVTTPTPSVQTTYGTGGTEGFTADQQYADGRISHWYPSADWVGTYPPGAEPTTPASGLLRTVAAFVPSPTPPTPPHFTG
jgi:hypothetical protein